MDFISFSLFNFLPKEHTVTHSNLPLGFVVDGDKLNLLKFEEPLTIFIQMSRGFVFAAQIQHVISISQCLYFNVAFYLRIALVNIQIKFRFSLLDHIVLLNIIYVLIAFKFQSDLLAFL
jgi:hypothetical protein